MGEEQKRKEEEEVRTKTVNNFSVDKPCDLLPLRQNSQLIGTRILKYEQIGDILYSNFNSKQKIP